MFQLKWILSMGAFLFIGCAAVQEVSNTNLAQQTNTIKHDQDYLDELDKKVSLVTQNQVKGCRLIGDVDGSDTLMEPGKDVATWRLKQKTLKVGGNAVIISAYLPRDRFGWDIEGKAYHCPNP